jgi:hypothetical protein
LSVEPDCRLEAATSGTQIVLGLESPNPVGGGGVQARQRVVKTKEAFDPGAQEWVPYTVHGATGDEEPREVDVESGDYYAAVDDVADGMVVLSVSDWPRLDREGRLFWNTPPVELVVSGQEAKAIVNAGRSEAGITAPDRPIRVGDVFLVRGLPDRHAGLGQASLVLDISAAARDAARVALYGAATSALPIDDAKKLAVTQAYEKPEPDSGRFDVGQWRVERPGGGGTAS